MCDMEQEVFLAPMSGVTDLAFRLISREFGAKLCFFEMMDANALIRNHPATLRIIKTHQKDTPVAAQLLGRDPLVMLDAAHRLQGLAKISFLDVNSACPAKKVVKKGAGAYLLKDTATLCKILKKLTSSLSIPVTVKIRTGFHKISVSESQEIAQKCADCGVSTLFVHGRTRDEGYRGGIDYAAIKAIKKAVSIPVFGSGNIFNPILAKKMFVETGCNGILVARGALGNPWIFNRIQNYLEKAEISEAPSLPVKKDILKRHLSLLEKHKETRESTMLGIMCKIAMWYLKGLPDAGRMRRHICAAKTYGELNALIDNIT